MSLSSCMICSLFGSHHMLDKPVWRKLLWISFSDRNLPIMTMSFSLYASWISSSSQIQKYGSSSSIFLELSDSWYWFWLLWVWLWCFAWIISEETFGIYTQSLDRFPVSVRLSSAIGEPLRSCKLQETARIQTRTDRSRRRNQKGALVPEKEEDNRKTMRVKKRVTKENQATTETHHPVNDGDQRHSL